MRHLRVLSVRDWEGRNHKSPEYLFAVEGIFGNTNLVEKYMICEFIGPRPNIIGPSTNIFSNYCSV